MRCVSSVSVYAGIKRSILRIQQKLKTLIQLIIDQIKVYMINTGV